MRLVAWRYYIVVFAAGVMIASVLTRHTVPAAPPRRHAAADTSLRAAASKSGNSLSAPLPFVATRDPSERGATRAYPVRLRVAARPSPGPAQRSIAPAQASRPSTASDAIRPRTPVHAVPAAQTSGAAAPRASATHAPSAGPRPAGKAVEPTTTAPDASPTSFYPVPEAGTSAPNGDLPQTASQAPRFHVQVGVFDKPEDAEALAQRLRALGYVATTAEHDGYQVWVGGYFERETAESLAANLRKAGFDATLVP